MASFLFVLNDIEKMAESTAVMAGIDDIVDLKFSDDMLSIIAEASSCTDCIVALQMWPHYFSRYECNQDQYSWIYLRDIFPLMFNFSQCSFSTFSFSVQVPHRATITFEDPYGLVWENTIELNPSDDSRDVGEYDITTFVSMDAREFIDLVMQLHMFHYVLVTLTSTQVKFSYASTVEIILTRESGQCVIGGVAPATEIRFLITLHPMQTFINLAHRALRIWFFRSNNVTKGIIAAVLGLDSRFLVYFPQVRS